MHDIRAGACSLVWKLRSQDSWIPCALQRMHGDDITDEAAWDESMLYYKWFEPRSISSLLSVIVRLSVALKRTVVDNH